MKIKASLFIIFILLTNFLYACELKNNEFNFSYKIDEKNKELEYSLSRKDGKESRISENDERYGC